MRSSERQSSVSSGMSCDAKTARPAVAVSRTSNRGVDGAPTGSDFAASRGGADEAEDGREMLQADEAVVEVGSSEEYIVNVGTDVRRVIDRRAALDNQCSGREVDSCAAGQASGSQ